MSYRAVIFDLGGVVFPSPFDAFAEYERARELPERFIRNVVAASSESGAWACLERGELSFVEFCAAFDAECVAAGGTVDTADLMAAIGAGFGPRPPMLRAVQIIRERGLKTGALTNNWARDGAPDPAGVTDRPGLSDVVGLFDVVVESAVVGLRKPDPRIYRFACERLAVEPADVIFLDDLGINLKPARELGMTTIKVVDPDAALAELEAVLGFAVRV
jgi:putative hydrolase of the HAD superfamily